MRSPVWKYWFCLKNDVKARRELHEEVFSGSLKNKEPKCINFFLYSEGHSEWAKIILLKVVLRRGSGKMEDTDGR